MLNHQIQNYKFISLLGEGGMAKVYLAQDNKFDTNVAVKLLNKEFVNNENIRKRFLAEARSMFKMSHPNIIKVTDLIEDGDTVAFVMEYVEGETLKEYIERKGKLKDSEIKTIFSQMLDAVCYVHEQNLVHRDIKPSNFMLDKNGKIKLMDFGIAKTTDSNSAEYTQTGTGMQMGTPMYMSPEQIRSSKEVNHLTDIYSLGVVLWQMVVGQKPYDTRTLSNFDLQSKIVNEPLPKSNTVWDDIIAKATQKNPVERYINIQSFQVAIQHPTNEHNSEKTILETKTEKKEETVVEESKKNTNPSTSHNNAPSSSNESKKTSSKKGLFIGIGVILFSLIVILFWKLTKPEKNDFGYEVKTFSNANIRAVKIPGKSYYMGETEITRAQFEAFVNATGYQTTAEEEGWSWVIDGSDAYKKDGVNWRYNVSGTNQQPSNHPVIHVSAYDARAFANWAGGRLPTVDEWYFAANGGQNFRYAGSNNIDEVAWYGGNSNDKTHPVKSKKPNGYGLYDMSGNVWEETATASESTSVMRGGCWYYDDAEVCRVAYRNNTSPDGRSGNSGFRVLFP
jgi:serine/threonine protein kinase